jgi:NADPH:quinone reductase-like Zn-dependent oxidoreductase
VALQIEVAPTPLYAEGGRMKAVVQDRYGSPDVLELRELAKPELTDDAVLVRVRAASLNRGDWYGLTGTPWLFRAMSGLRRPKNPILGWDFAGTVDAVGSDVTHVQPGDEVYGGSIKTLAEYAIARKAVERKPANLTFEEAAAVPVAALTALQGLRDKGGLQPGQNVLINGASGGVGTFAVQIAKALGANVTAVCSTRNVEQARSLGADDVVDYTREDFTKSGRRYDLMLDVAGGKSWRQCKRVLTSEAALVVAGAPKGGRMFGPLPHIAKMWLAGKRSRRKIVFFVANTNNDDLVVLRELIEAGKLKPVVERRYALGDVADAFRYLGEGHTQGKLVITV